MLKISQLFHNQLIKYKYIGDFTEGDAYAKDTYS
jgi:hypothetical protein